MLTPAGRAHFAQVNQLMVPGPDALIVDTSHRRHKASVDEHGRIRPVAMVRYPYPEV